MVPSIIPPPIPFIDVVAGTTAAVEYIAARVSSTQRDPRPAGDPGCGCAKAPAAGSRAEWATASAAGSVFGWDVWREFVACRRVAQGKLRTPPPGTILPLRCERVEADGKVR